VQLTIDSSESIDRVLAVIGALYGVELATTEVQAAKPPARTRPVSRTAARKTAAPGKPSSRKATARPPRRTSPAKPDAGLVRAWAKANGHELSDRGRVPAHVTAAYIASGSPTG
jgi:hypothetical protein